MRLAESGTLKAGLANPGGAAAVTIDGSAKARGGDDVGGDENAEALDKTKRSLLFE